MSKLDAKDLKEFLKPGNKSPDGKIKSLVTGESIKTFLDFHKNKKITILAKSEILLRQEEIDLNEFWNSIKFTYSV